jgi:purine-binding chemotaxis protein CheW
MNQFTDISKAQVTEQSTALKQFIAFSVGGREFGVDIMAVREIRGWSGTTPIPNSPAAVLGVVNLRGTIVPVVDLRVSFNIAQTDPTRTHVVFIVKIGDRVVGLLVDSVSDILSVRDSDIQPIREVEEASRDSAVSQIIVLEGRLVGLISLEKLIGQLLLDGAARGLEQSAS